MSVSLDPLSHRSSFPFPVQYISTYFQALSIPAVLPQKKLLMYPQVHFELTEGEGFLLGRRISLIQITKYYEGLICNLTM